MFRHLEYKILGIHILSCIDRYAHLAAMRLDQIEVCAVVCLVVVQLDRIELCTLRSKLYLDLVVCQLVYSFLSKSCLREKGILVCRHIKHLDS